MDRASLKDLDTLDRDALLALVQAHQEELAAQQGELRSLQVELESQRQTVSQQADELRTRSERIEHMKLMIEKLRHVIYGTKSEKIVLKLEQLEFALEEEETTQAEAEAATERVSPAPAVKTRSERKPLPEHLRRELVTHLPERDCCPDCGGELRHFGDDVSEQLEYVPHSFRVIRHVRPKFTCTGCDRVVEAPAPSRPIERGLAGPGLLAHVIVSKFADHLPLYRQSEIYARQGVVIPRSTLAGWVGAASDLLSPLVDAIEKHVLAGRKLHADDTPMPVLSPGSGKTRTGRLWTYVRDDRQAGRRTDCACCVVRIFRGSQRRTSPATSEELQGRSAGRRLCRISSFVRQRCLRGRLLGACTAQVPRNPCHPRLAYYDSGHGQDWRVVRDRRGDTRQAC